ncbi:recombination protein RecR [candidate division KSB1 bacterium]|nr:recombination protein RecR [candidate division KSB1 bacterium]
MKKYTESLQIAIEELSKLPGIGQKSAQRLVFYLLKLNKDEVQKLSDSLIAIKEKIKYCSRCHNISESDLCDICSDPGRDQSIICVVEEASDIIAFEKTGEYHGLYHVLGGALSPLDGIGPNDLTIQELLNRMIDGVKEIIIATNPDTEGEATALYLYKLITPYDVTITRIARGIPIGTDLEYMDELTLTRAMEGRLPFK